MPIPVLPNKNMIDTVGLQKMNASNRILTLLNEVEKKNNEKMMRTASFDPQQLIKAFMTILSCLKLNVENNGDVVDIISDFSKNATSNNGNKLASTIKNAERKDEIKIVSKSQKDSHYQIDISKDLVNKDKKSVFMISCYARDAYLGRYLIKRNFFYSGDREESANQAYEEILTKTAAIKERYYNEVIDVSDIFSQMKKMLDGVISEIKSEEDSVGNINR